MNEAQIEALPQVRGLRARIRHLEEQLESAKAIAEIAETRGGRIADLERELREAQTLLQQQQQMLRSGGNGKGGPAGNGSGAYLIGVVLQVKQPDGTNPGSLFVRVEGKTVESPFPAKPPTKQPEAEEDRPAQDLKPQAEEQSPYGGEAQTQPAAETEAAFAPGDFVRVSPQSLQVVGKVEGPPLLGPITVVKCVLDDSLSIEIEHGGQKAVAATGKFAGTVKKDHRVVLDQTLAVVLADLGEQEQPFAHVGATRVSWDDIGGLEEAKKALRDAIERPHHKKVLFKRLKRKGAKGVLLYGAPGCGKTMLGKAVATELARIYLGDGAQAPDSGLIVINGPEVLEKWVGNSEANLRAPFRAAKAHFEKHGYPMVLFIDEADALFPRRGTGISSDIHDSLVTTWNAELDGVQESAIIVIMATNRPDILDPAVIRPGRIDRKVEITRPDKVTVEKIFRIHLRETPLLEIDLDTLAARAAEACFSDEYVLSEIHLDGQPPMQFALRDLISGALVANIADRAKEIVMDRYEDKSDEECASAGLIEADVIEAIKRVHAENAKLEHPDAEDEFARDKGGRIIGVKRQRQAST